MATVTVTHWINPLTRSTQIPTLPGEILTAAVAYWEDEVMELRGKRPRGAAREEHLAKMDHAVRRLTRFRQECDAMGRDMRRVSSRGFSTTLALATSDLEAVMRK